MQQRTMQRLEVAEPVVETTDAAYLRLHLLKPHHGGRAKRDSVGVRRKERASSRLEVRLSVQPLCFLTLKHET
jgi:hypothetical protein